MVDQNDGVAVIHQIVHHAGEADDVGRVQTDGRLIQHVEDARRAVAHGTGQLHPLALAGGERGSRAVERQVTESQVHEPFGGTLERLADALGHRAHVLRQAGRDAPHPFDQLRERHRAGFVQRDAAHLRRAGGGGQARAAAVRADIFLQEFFHPLHSLLVLDLC